MIIWQCFYNLTIAELNAWQCKVYGIEIKGLPTSRNSLELKAGRFGVRFMRKNQHSWNIALSLCANGGCD